MKQLFGNRGFRELMSLIVALSLSTVAAAEKRDQSCVKKNYRSASKTVIGVGEGRELIQEVVIGDIKFSNPDFTSKEEWSYLQSDVVNGSGKDTGYYIDTHADGSKTYGAFEGTKKLVTKSDGTWELSWEGTYKYLGGTGKFKNIKGGGKYKGGASTTDPGGIEHCQETVEY